ncbi:glycosyltransferase [Bacillus sp. E214]|uniref:glycosyltransferase n=1 Tax=Bacillus sp. E214 TaxID=2587156 RepID=UPI0011DFBAAB|nr:glycosyltransferase [Bacillus sp. E214]
MKKNIIIYREWLLGYSETFIYDQTNELVNFKPYYVGLKKIDGINLKERSVITLSNGSAFGKLKYYINKITGFNFFLTSYIKRLNPVLIHAHFGPDAVNGLKLAKKLGLPFFVTFHGSDITRKKENANSIWLKKYYKNQQKIFSDSTKVIAVSNYIKEKLIENGCPEDKIVVHYTGIKIEHKNNNIVNNSISNEKIILFVGRLVENKGLNYLIDAMQTVQRNYRDAKLIVIGEGPLKKELESYAQKKLSNFIFLGKLPHTRVMDIMRQSNIFCVPSVEIETGESEGLGMVFLEASSNGLPIVSFKTGGIKEAVIDGETGILCKPKDTEELATKLLYLLNNKDIATQFGENGIKYTEENFNIRKQNMILEKIYKENI